jgi:hypothetical protein
MGSKLTPLPEKFSHLPGKNDVGMCLDSTPEMGEYSVEVRRESFYLRGEDCYDREIRHAIELYPSSKNGSHSQGTVEILIEDIPKIRAALDLVERYLRSR